MLNELGLIPTLRWLLRQFESQYQITARLEAPDACSLSGTAETNIFRVTQEALTNVAKHSRARSVHVMLATSPDGVTLTIRDDGVGFDPEKRFRADAPTLGLIGMRERARQLHGRMVVTSIPGHGTTVELTVPLASDRSLSPEQ